MQEDFLILYGSYVLVYVHFIILILSCTLCLLEYLLLFYDDYNDDDD